MCKYIQSLMEVQKPLSEVAVNAISSSFLSVFFFLQQGIDLSAKQDPSMMAMLLEMGFRDQRLNQQLLKKHSYSLLHTVNELVQMAEDRQSKAGSVQH